MLATFIIGLREGLEAALIVGIIAAFLRRNGRSLVPMAIGVTAAIVISLLVGISLRFAEQSLPQAAQEGLETVIGVVAIVFVTGMVLWMSTNARGLKSELETSAAAALGQGSTRALVVMAFLAVLKEGFETSVFLLATFSASTNATLAAVGAGLGIVVAAVIGYGLYTGGMRIDLGRFFSVTSAFLVLVAAGLVVSTLGTAREAGWLNAGQQRAADLSWLAPNGSIRGALFTGVLGIPPYPTVIQVIGWFAYLVPVALYLYWPRRWRPTGAAAIRLRLIIGTGLAVFALGLAIGVRPAAVTPSTSAPVLDATGAAVGTVTLAAGTAQIVLGSQTGQLPLQNPQTVNHGGLDEVDQYTQTATGSTDGLPDSITVAELTQLNGGRLPVGVNPQRSVGPFDAAWSISQTSDLWVAQGQLLDFSRTEVTTLTLTGGGLTTSRTLTVSGQMPGGRSVSSDTLSTDPAYVQEVTDELRELPAAQLERQFWGRQVPVLLGVAALVVLASAWNARRRLAAQKSPPSAEPARTEQPLAPPEPTPSEETGSR
ncbi:iron uptake transporter permease EfeU [Naumannella halotolerans]|uniref:High-affinity iron transporter n=1 Tax=Naumannella halotolerans TaxID=993414 RepID=A0A4R7IYH9_9ACTN|nr:iron uptake transporter permease EfeU [Naumannella halotolerans]TDT29821.1 high-affinity iron transporter [Naumannella halotolerans]